MYFFFIYSKKKFSCSKKKFRLQYRYQNLTLVSVTNTKTWFGSCTTEEPPDRPQILAALKAKPCLSKSPLIYLCHLNFRILRRHCSLGLGKARTLTVAKICIKTSLLYGYHTPTLWPKVPILLQK